MSAERVPGTGIITSAPGNGIVRTRRLLRCSTLFADPGHLQVSRNAISPSVSGLAALGVGVFRTAAGRPDLARCFDGAELHRSDRCARFGRGRTRHPGGE